MSLNHLFSSLALLLLLVSPLMAQTPSASDAQDEKEKAEKELARKKELEGKAFLLLDDVIASAPTLKLAENRAIIQANAANLIWERDEKRAREIFREALNNLRQQPSMGSGKNQETFWAYLRLREETLRIVARRDPGLALELLRATRQPPQPRAGASYVDPDYELRLENSIAGQVALSDPKRALQMAKENLAKGFSLELLNLLNMLHYRDQALAQELAREIVNKLRSENLVTNVEAGQLALVLVSMTNAASNSLDSAEEESRAAARQPFRLDEDDLRDLVWMLTRAALSESQRPYLLSGILRLMPLVEKYMPVEAVQLRRRVADLNRTLNPNERSWSEYDSLQATGTPEQMIEAAERAPAESREFFYQQAIIKAAVKGEGDRLRQFISDNVRDESRRARLLAYLEEQSVGFNIYRGKIEEVRRMLPRLRSKEQRAHALAFLATTAMAKNDSKMALELLDEARQLISTQPKTEAQVNAVLEVALAYTLVEPARGFEIIEALIDRANEVITAAATLDGFINQRGLFKKGEMVLSQQGPASFNYVFSRYGKGVAALARANFERMKQTADKFNRNELRVMSRLLIAQSVLMEKALNENLQAGGTGVLSGM